MKVQLEGKTNLIRNQIWQVIWICFYNVQYSEYNTELSETKTWEHLQISKLNKYIYRWLCLKKSLSPSHTQKILKMKFQVYLK